MDDAGAGIQRINALKGAGTEQPPLTRRILRAVIHRLSYIFIYNRSRTRHSRAAGLQLTVRPTVFHPRWFITSEYFAGIIRGMDLKGKRVADVGTGSGILALSAAKAGAARVVAIDINPNAALSAADNARLNGLSDRVNAVCSNLMSALAPRPIFDVIISSPPSFAGEPLDLADRAWHAGPQYRDIVALFEQARERLVPGGRLLVLLSSDSDLKLMTALADRAGFHARVIHERSILIESLLIYEMKAE